MTATLQRSVMQAVYILHQRPYRNTSAILEVLSAEHGRMGLVARGVRGARPRWRGHIQAFRPLLCSYNGRGDLRTLTAVEPAGPALMLQGKALVCGLYLNELLLRLLHRHDPEPVVFARYQQTVQRLAALAETESGALEQELRYFEVQILDTLGYGLVLDREAHTGAALQSETLYDYRLDIGPVAAAAGMAGEGIAVHGLTLTGLASQTLAGVDQLLEAKRLLRSVITSHLNGKPLYTRELFRSMAVAELPE